jgi:hypothetical protein
VASSSSNSQLADNNKVTPNTKKNEQNIENTQKNTTNLSKTIQTKRSKPQILRYFTHASPNQGFQFLHLPIRGKSKLKDLRADLRQLGLSSGSILDIQYPTSSIVSLLVHNDYVATATDILSNCGLHLLTDFDPLDPQHLKDPKFANESDDFKRQKLLELQQARYEQTLAFLRPPVQAAVARSFARDGRISQDLLQKTLASLPDHNPTPPKKRRSNLLFQDSSDSDIEVLRDASCDLDDDTTIPDATSLAGAGEPAPFA